MMQSLPEWRREKVSAFAEFTPEDSVLTKLRFNAALQETFKDFRSTMTAHTPIGYLTLNERTTFNKLNDLNLSAQSDWQLTESHFLVAGAEYIKGDLDTSTKSKSFMGSSSSMAEGSQTTWALYAQDEWSATEDWTLAGGARYTNVKNQIDNTNDTKVSVGSESKANTAVSLGAVYSGFDNWNLRSNFSQGFRMANLQDMFIGAMGLLIPNPNLKPEESNNFEVGARYNHNGFSLDTGVYYTTAKNYMDVQAVGSQYITVNQDSAKTVGMETALSYKFDSGIKHIRISQSLNVSLRTRM